MQGALLSGSTCGTSTRAKTGSEISIIAAMEHSTDSSAPPPLPEPGTETEKRFHGWRLLGFIMTVIVIIAIVSAVVDWAVIGPLEGRAY